jgi:hypothetical protein
MSAIPNGATHFHRQTNRHYKQDAFGFWLYWDKCMWVQSICVDKAGSPQLIRLESVQ